VHVLRRRGAAAVLLAPFIVSSAVAGWLAYGPDVDGPKIAVTERGRAEDERWLGEALRLRGVHHAAAQYFLSYRLGFLWHEDPIVVPLEPQFDRYAPYRAAFDAARAGAYVFHPSEPRARPEEYEASLRRAHVPFERETIAGFTVLVFHRPLEPSGAISPGWQSATDLSPH